MAIGMGASQFTPTPKCVTTFIAFVGRARVQFYISRNEEFDTEVGCWILALVHHKLWCFEMLVESFDTLSANLIFGCKAYGVSWESV